MPAVQRVGPEGGTGGLNPPEEEQSAANFGSLAEKSTNIASKQSLSLSQCGNSPHIANTGDVGKIGTRPNPQPEIKNVHNAGNDSVINLEFRSWQHASQYAASMNIPNALVHVCRKCKRRKLITLSLIQFAAGEKIITCGCQAARM